jgi:hypothetical protein
MANRAKLSAAMLSLIAAGASAPVLFDQFISEKEGNAGGRCRSGWRLVTVSRRNGY